jgi:DNA-binding HxlR family transcriptional regulator
VVLKRNHYFGGGDAQTREPDVKRKNMDAAPCPIARSLGDVGDWWSLLIVRDGLRGNRRFSEFQKSLGLAKNILAARLKKLVACGIFRLEPASDGSSYQEYVLTDKGRALNVVTAALRVWGTRWLFGNDPDAPVVLDRITGEEIVGFGFRTRSGRLVAPSEIQYVTEPIVRPSARRRRVPAGD